MLELRNVGFLGITSDDVFEILERRPFRKDVRHIIRVDARICTCLQRQVEGISCLHVINAIWYKRKKPAEFCHEMYSREKYEATYVSVLYPLPDKKMWKPSSSMHVNALRRTQQADRQKKKVGGMMQMRE